MNKQASLPVLAALTLSIALLAAPLGTALGQEAGTSETPPMPMMPGRPGGRGMMNPEMMKQRQEMMRQHMTKMEEQTAKMVEHLANIEALLRELVELNKAK